MAWYGESKVYNDGSHYIAIPHTTRLVKKRPKPLEELITVEENNDVEGSENVVSEPSHPVIEFEEVEKLSETERGENGHGSTGN